MESQRKFTDLKALFINCSIKKDKKGSHTQHLIDKVISIMEHEGVAVDQIYALDHKIAFGMIKDGKDAEAQAIYADEEKAKAARMRSFSELSSKDASEVCLKCHEGTQGRSEERFNFRRSEHFRHGVS